VLVCPCCSMLVVSEDLAFLDPDCEPTAFANFRIPMADASSMPRGPRCACLHAA
jgi:hypothetical protein